MVKISESSMATYQEFQTQIRSVMNGFDSFEQAAQHFTSALHKNFEESIALARIFATVPYGQLPEENKKIVGGLARDKGVSELLNDNTLVLSLLGTSGDNPDWNNRKSSQGHVGIPLVSANFIEAIPMMSRLLKQLGLGLDWIGSADTSVVKHTIGSMSGVFYVADASQEVDRYGRKVIAAQDFVAQHGIKSVFGFGGGYLTGASTFSVTTIFMRESVSESQARLFASAMAFFKTVTGPLVSKKMFD